MTGSSGCDVMAILSPVPLVSFPVETTGAGCAFGTSVTTRRRPGQRSQPNPAGGAPLSKAHVSEPVSGSVPTIHVWGGARG